MNYHAKRVGQAIVTLFAVITISFFMYRLLPGGPVEAMRQQLIQQALQNGGEVDTQRINQLVELYTGIQPDEPIWIQYLHYLRDVVVYQDFGRSIWKNKPVFQILFVAMPWSVFVSIYGLLLGFTTNVLLGALMAYREGSYLDKGMSLVATISTSVPYYVAAILMLSYLAFELGWFPTGGRYNSELTAPGFNAPFMISVVKHAALPILTGFVVGFGGGALAMRGNSLRILGKDYIRVARLRGLSQTRIATRYVTRNAILPMYTTLMVGIASIFSSSVIMEQIFNYPGVGWYTFGAIQNRDYPLLMGVMIFFTIITLLGVLIAEFTYGLIDPRAGTAEKESY
ncbi:peptide/nickel transport system permease protein [Halogranum amylolyticum]|uniref:Peptide/nickel transport system permease protein n=1 Tax=Halogranum amylolyticum TaxID=660520 RepID=A0A1H8UJ59_9EURY|nr:ABC transporter permease [Halogranum amylolyticum]SEP02904.1 peptide/nickel transport system permease protein [Halogranum amylolyticum]